jgi:MFS transporter, DHA2 family, multidrug resistance protein
MTPASTDAMNVAPPAMRGQASGVTHTLRQVGGTVGLAIMGTALATVQHDRLTAFADRARLGAAQREHVRAVLAAAHGDPALLRSLPASVLEALQQSLVAGMTVAYAIGATFVLAGAALAWARLRRVPAVDAMI